ncbi:MAG: 6-aminohexanoate hydrolase [Sphingomonas bacterium]|uniref:amidase n=1 Tax=Sphingomonas bacterium TaxID=1895847 RepID=UPI002609FBE4|nr:amidase family protein [Sphingomonas bacterium]MDB5695076.1 6-aminohexanoate hydrolase [Sphingomonas bacterium]
MTITSSDYAGADGLGLAKMVRDRAVTPLELVDAAIARIERLDGTINAVAHRRFDEARAQARGPAGDGAFAGVPFMVKDFGIGVAGWPNTSGSRFCRDVVDSADTGLMTRYRESGVIPIGRGASSEFGIVGNVETAAGGAVRNPWNTDHLAGGSSGGSAAAVAAGYVPMAHASDGLGSIRIPAACCGLVGLKPTRDRNPNLPDGFDYAMGFCVDHVVTRSVRDSAAMLDVTGRPEPGSPYAVPAKAGPYLDEVTRALGRLRIAWSTQTPSGAAIDPEVQGAVERVAADLAALGHEVFPQDLGVDYRAIYAARAPVSGGNFAAGMRRVVERVGREPTPDELEPLTWAAYTQSKAITGEQAFWGLQELRMLSREVVRRFEEFDVFLCPVMTAAPPPIGHIAGASIGAGELSKRQAALFPYAALFNFTGQPSMSLPLAMSADGLPIGLMITGRYADEATLFRLAGQLEREWGWPDLRDL